MTERATSSRTPTECVELALDTEADSDDREDAIHELRAANECDELASLASNPDIEEQYRRRALQGLDTSQCESMLEQLVEEDSLDPSLQRAAEELLQERERD